MVTLEELIKHKQPVEYKKLCILKMSLTLRGQFKEATKWMSEVVKQAAIAVKEISKKLAPIFKQMAREETRKAMGLKDKDSVVKH